MKRIVTIATLCGVVGLLSPVATVAGDLRPAMLKAISQNDLAAVTLQIKEGVSVNATNRAGWCALHYAAVRGYADIAGRLIEGGATVNAATRRHKTALHLASERGCDDVAKLLVKHGAALGVEDQDGWTPDRKSVV